MRICYLTCGFVDLQPSIRGCTALIETRIAGAMLLLSALLPSWKLACDAANKSPKTIISYLDSAKRSLPRSTGGLPLEPGAFAPSWWPSATACDRTSPASAAKRYPNRCVYFH